MPGKENIFMQAAVDLARRGMREGRGGPFGCVIVKDGKIIAEGNNSVLTHNDPTAHAEVVAIRNACKALNDFQLTGCEIYTSCEPCPMCLGAIYWARPSKVYFANTREDAAAIGFDDSFIYNELKVPFDARAIEIVHLDSEDAKQVFREWNDKPDKIPY